MKSSVVIVAWAPAALLLAGCGGSDGSTGPDASLRDPSADVLVTPDADPGSDVPSSSLDLPSALDGTIDGGGSSTAVQYAMTATISQVLLDGGYPGAPPPPAAHSFSLLVDWNAQTAISGANRSSKRIGLRRIGEREWESTEALAFNLGWWAGPALTYSKLTLVRDKDGCSATASGTSTQIRGDIVYETPFTATLVGVPDQAGPQLSVVPSGEVHPLAFTGVLVNELLPAGTTAALDGASTSLELAPAMVDGTLGVSAFSLPGKALAFGATYHLRVAPDAMDLAGNKTTASIAFATSPDPGLFAQDGFEGPIRAYASGFTEVTSAGALPIPAGAKAIGASPVDSSTPCNARFTARLAVPGGAASVKFTFLLFRLKSGTFSFPPLYQFAVAVPNGAATSTWDSALTTTPLPKPWTGDPPSSATYVYGDLLEAQVPLPAGASTEVLFDVARTCAEPALPEPGIIIDSLRVE